MARRPSKNRLNPYSVMEHSGFGGLSIMKGNVRVNIPQDCLNKEGLIKYSAINKALSNELVAMDMTSLYNKFGITCEVI